jgi:hypothetical protein
MPRFHRSRTPALALLLPLAAVAAGCVDPSDRRPGTWLSGEVVTQPVDDWSFSDAHAEIRIETRTPWWIRHSVTIVCASRDGRLYVGARDPEGKRWVANVARDPRVRLEIGERLYEGRLVPVEDPARREEVYAAYAAKYAWPATPPEERPPLRLWEVVEPGRATRERP